ncbi:hypothetical protein J6590_103974 [Homalodisca vitripennis]|nr:hypothetical protein J6590_103974 [Homalodisca vitripennis]
MRCMDFPLTTTLARRGRGSVGLKIELLHSPQVDTDIISDHEVLIAGRHRLMACRLPSDKLDLSPPGQSLSQYLVHYNLPPPPILIPVPIKQPLHLSTAGTLIQLTV